jgi:hypothetical protein
LKNLKTVDCHGRGRGFEPRRPIADGLSTTRKMRPEGSYEAIGGKTGARSLTGSPSVWGAKGKLLVAAE